MSPRSSGGSGWRGTCLNGKSKGVLSIMRAWVPGPSLFNHRQDCLGQDVWDNIALRLEEQASRNWYALPSNHHYLPRHTDCAGYICCLLGLMSGRVYVITAAITHHSLHCCCLLLLVLVRMIVTLLLRRRRRLRLLPQVEDFFAVSAGRGRGRTGARAYATQRQTDSGRSYRGPSVGPGLTYANFKRRCWLLKGSNPRRKRENARNNGRLAKPRPAQFFSVLFHLHSIHKHKPTANRTSKVCYDCTTYTSHGSYQIVPAVCCGLYNVHPQRPVLSDHWFRKRPNITEDGG